MIARGSFMTGQQALGWRPSRVLALRLLELAGQDAELQLSLETVPCWLVIAQGEHAKELSAIFERAFESVA